jgi:hypothetical protein
MFNDFIMKHIKRVNRNTLIVSFIVMFLSIILMNTGGKDAFMNLPSHVNEKDILAKVRDNDNFNNLHIKMNLNNREDGVIDQPESNTKLIFYNIGTSYLAVSITSDSSYLEKMWKKNKKKLIKELKFISE